MSGRARTEQWLRRTWQHRGWFASLLWPLSVVYRALVALRRTAYRRGWITARSLPVPVIVVGNVIAGGAGKTPLTLWLVQHARQRGWRPGVISRGHGRRAEGVCAVGADSDPADVGDEPLLIHRRTGVPVWVAPSRHSAGRSLLQAHPEVDLLICDDGLQHLALARDLEICVFDGRGIGNGWLLPAGPLREPWPRAVDLCLQARPSGDAGRTIAQAHALQRQLVDWAQTADGSRVALAELAATPVTAVAGIAQPDRFFDELRSRGLTLVRTQAWPDHHPYDDWDLPEGPVVCTEKDAVKLWRRHPSVLAVPLDLRPDNAFVEALDRHLDRLRAAARSL